MTADQVHASRPVRTGLVELRQYTLHPGARDTLIELFEREFIETQEACGMSVIGQFRDLDRPDRFVWLRGFDDPASRTAALAAFYGGPDWLAHRDAANATMIDFDDVLMLRPAEPGSGFALDAARRPARGESGPADLFEAVICPVPPQRIEDFSRAFRDMLAPALRERGCLPVATLVTDRSPNGFPRLPVREDASVFVFLLRLAGDGASAALSPGLASLLDDAPTRLRLAPTARSLLR